MRLKISARKSDLARLQAYMVGETLQKKFPGTEIEYRFKESLGDKNLTDPLWKIPEKGVFTEDFNQELLSGETDMVVHSWKDLPTELKSQTEIIATLPRADQRDLLLVKKNHFPRITGARRLHVYSSSPRRSYNLTPFFKEALPFSLQEVSFESVRGNIPTRIRKLLESSETDGLIVAKAALDRLLTAPQAEFSEVRKFLRDSLAQLNWMVLPLTVNPNAAAQGALAVEIVKSREDLKKIFAAVNQPADYDCAQKERQVLASFGGGCHQKIGVAVLQRPYGQIQILKGLSDAGQVLDQYEILGRSSPRFAPHELFSADEVGGFERRELPFAGLPATTNALYVGKAEAWPTGLHFDKIIWASGLQTWKKLARQGHWVHGCSESLGESEETRVETLAGESLHWSKLTHSEGVATSDKAMIATYELTLTRELPDLRSKKAFYWSSGGLFLRALARFPEIASAFHACGPGHTYEIIRKELSQRQSDPANLQIFLTQNEWRRQCTI
jgi:hydroxymethylbilane synthase